MLPTPRVLLGAFLLAWSIFTPAQRPRLGLQLGEDRILKASLSRNGKLLFTGSAGSAPSARLYDVATGRLIRSFVGHTSTIDAVALSPDASRAATASDDRTLRIWDVHTGLPLLKIEPGESLNNSYLTWSPDGKYIVAGTDPITTPDIYTIRVWDSADGLEVAKFVGTGYDAPSRFSPDGKFLYFYAPNPPTATFAIAKVAVSNFKVVKTYLMHSQPSDFSSTPDNKLLYALTVEGVCVVDQSTGSVLGTRPTKGTTLATVAGGPYSLSLGKNSSTLVNEATGHQIANVPRPETFWGWAASGNGRILAQCGETSVTCFEVATGKQICETKGLTTAVADLASIGDFGIGLGTRGDHLALWSLKTGQRDLDIHGKGEEFEVVAAAPEQGLLVTAGHGPKLTLRKLESGVVLGEIPFEGEGCLDARFSPNGKWLAFATYSSPLTSERKTPSIQIYDLNTHTVIKRWDAQDPDFVRFSPTSKWLAVSDNHRARLFRTTDWTEETPIGSDDRRVSVVEFTPDGGELWASTFDGVILRINLDNLKSLPGISQPHAQFGEIAFTRIGERVAAYPLYGKFAIYDTRTCEPLVTLEDPTSAVIPLAFTKNGRYLLGGLLDGSVRVWDATTGKIVATFVSFNDGTWATVDTEGRYDASNGGDVEGLFWLLGNTPLALSQFKSYYYDPHLLAKILGFDPEKPREVPDLNGIGLFPDVTVALNPQTKVATVTVTDQGGGIGATEIALNGVTIGTHPPPPPGTRRFTFDVNTAAPNVASRLLPVATGADAVINRLEAATYNAAASVRGRMTGVDLRGAVAGPPSNLYALVVGSNYPGTNRTLRFPVSDATAFADGLQLASAELLGKDRVHISRLVSQDDGTTPTKAHVLSAMAQIAKSAKPVDVVLVYFAGHGVGRAAGRGGYYYLTAEAGNADPEVDPLATRFTLSSAELAKWLQTEVKAAKRAIILDTCAAGSAVADLTQARTIPRDLELAWEQLKDNAGLYVLAGCAPDRVSYEATNVGHGLLTYSLLEAIDQAKPAALASHGFLEIDQWFDYAEVRVRELMDEIGLLGMQKPEKRAQANARDYPVGLVNSNVMGKLGLPLPGPVLILDTFRNSENDDPLNLTDAVDTALAGAATGRGTLAATYWPTIKRHPKALQLRGSYKVSGEQVTVTVRLMRFVGVDLRPQALDSFDVTGTKGQAGELVTAIIAATSQRIQQDWERVNQPRAQ